MKDAMRDARGGSFDEAIDRAVREMLDVEAPADLRARVLARIDGSAAPGVNWKWLLAPVAAAAIVILSLVLRLPSRPAAVPPVQSARNEGVPQAAPPAPARVATVARERSGARLAPTEPSRTPRRRRSERALAMNDGAPTVDEVAPLDPIVPIHVAAVTQPDISPQPIVIESLAPIAEVQIAPLTPPDGRH